MPQRLAEALCREAGCYDTLLSQLKKVGPLLLLKRQCLQQMLYGVFRAQAFRSCSEHLMGNLQCLSFCRNSASNSYSC